MTVSARTLLATVLAAGTLGGMVGALAAAATQSQASPAAIAAAVQRVVDQRAESELHAVNEKLAVIVRADREICREATATRQVNGCP